jgi:hypothetical protein
MTAERFPCTPGGGVVRGKNRLKLLLLGLTGLMVAVAVATWIAGRLGPGLIALFVAFIPWTAWRMSGDLDVLWLDLEAGRLTIQMRRRHERFAISGAEARRLTREEIAHLETLTESGGVSAGTGGFESHRLGEFDLYASNLGNAVLVDLGETRLIVTPDDPQGFLAAVGGDSRG